MQDNGLEMFSHKYMCMHVCAKSCAKSCGKSFAKSCVASELSLLFSEDEDELLDLLDSSDSESLVDFAFLFLLDSYSCGSSSWPCPASSCSVSF